MENSLTTRLVYTVLAVIAVLAAYGYIAEAEERLLDGVSTCIGQINAEYSTCYLDGGYSRTLPTVRT